MAADKGSDDPHRELDKGSGTIRSLRAAVDAVRTRQADQRDVVVDLGEAERARLDLLAAELLPLFEEIDEADERFDLAVSQGERPRMWIDMTTFVAMGHDKLSYRMVKDTRMGRIVMAETSDKDKMADIVAEYVAEKVLEREKMIEGEWRSMMSVKNAAVDLSSDAAAISTAHLPPKKQRRRGLMWFLLGLLCGLVLIGGMAFLLVPSAL